MASPWKRHRHQEFLEFLKAIDRGTPENLDIHCIVDNCIADNSATHKKQEIHSWLEQYPRFHFPFIPTSSSWLTLVGCETGTGWELSRNSVRKDGR